MTGRLEENELVLIKLIRVFKDIILLRLPAIDRVPYSSPKGSLGTMKVSPDWERRSPSETCRMNINYCGMNLRSLSMLKYHV